MTDNTNPNSNFHPYQPADAVPHAEAPEQGLYAVVEKVGIDPAKFRNFSERMRSRNAHDWLQSARSFVTSRPAMVLGGLALAIVASGLLRRRWTAA